MNTMEIVIPDLNESDSPVFGLAAHAQTNNFHSPHSDASSATFTKPNLPPLRNPFQSNSESPTRKTSATSIGTSAHSRTKSQNSSSSRPLPQHQASSSGYSEKSIVTSIASLPPVPGSSHRNVVPEGAAATELAAYIVLDQLFEKSEQKISEALGRPIDEELNLPSLLGVGVDSSFDALFESVAHVARKLPKLVIDLVMRWRKAQNEGIDAASVRKAIATAPNPLTARAVADTLNERKSLASIYILCRALNAIVNAVNRETLGEDLGSKLEDIIFNSLKNADPNQVARSANRQANLELYAQLIGALSGIRFVSVTDRFLGELEQVNRGFVAKEAEPRIEHIINGMRYLKICVYPLEAFEEAAEFIEALAVTFDAASGSRVKVALANVLTSLLSPVIKAATAEVNHPIWLRAMESIHSRALNMVSKPRYWAAALPLVCATVAAAPQEYLFSNWASCFDLCITKLKDRALRPLAIHGTIELLWAYLHRCHESHTAVTKRLEPFIKTIFPPGRRSLAPPDMPVEFAACIPHFILCRHFDLGSDLIIGLLGPSPSHNEGAREIFSPERSTVAIRALMLTLQCMQKSEEPFLPPLPTEDETFQLPQAIAVPLDEILLSRPGLRLLVETSAASIAQISMALLASPDHLTIHDDRNLLHFNALPAMSSMSPDRDQQVIRRNGQFTVTYSRDRIPSFELLKACLDSWPRCLRSEGPDFRPIDVLLHALVHVDPEVNAASRGALERLASLKDGASVIIALGRFLARPELLCRETATYQSATVAKFESIIRLWIELLNVWLEIIRVASSRPSPEANQMRKIAPVQREVNALDLDMNATSSLILEAEACGILLTLSHQAAIRRSGVEACRLADVLGERLSALHEVRGSPVLSGDKITRKSIIKVMETSGHLLTKLDEERLSGSERVRLHRWKRGGDSIIDTIPRLIESENASDLAIWHYILGHFSLLCLDQCPAPVAIARPLIAARVLRLYSPASISAGLVPARANASTPVTRTGPPSPLSPYELPFLSENWRSHLTALCAITTIVSIPSSDTLKGESPSVDRLSSGQEIIRLLIPFLASDNLNLRDGVIYAMGSIHPILHRPLLEGLHSIVKHLAEDRRTRQDQRNAGRRSQRHGRLHLSVTRIHEVISHLLQPCETIIADAILNLMVQFIKEAYFFLKDPESLDDPSAVAMRRPFCTTVRAFTEHCAYHDVLARWLPVEIRHNLFTLFDSWSFRPISATSPELSRAPVSRQGSEILNHTTPARSASLSSQAAAFEVFLPAVSVMATLCEVRGIVLRRDQPEKQQGTLEAQDILRWVQALFESVSRSGHAFARRALLGLLGSNLDHRPLLDATIFQCFSEPDTLALSQSTFSVLSEAVPKYPELIIKSSTMLCMALWKMGHPDLATRQRALDLLIAKLPPSAREENIVLCETALYSTFAGATLHARNQLAQVLASAHPSEARAVFLELAIRILQIGNKQTRLLLQLLVPWIEHLHLHLDLSTSRITDPVLANLFLLTAKYGDVYHLEIRDMWTTLTKANNGANFNGVLNFLVEETMRRGSKDFSRYAQRIIGCLCQSERSAAVLQFLSDLIQPTDMIATLETTESGPQLPSSNPANRRTNLDTMFPLSARRIPLSLAQAALLLVSDAFVARLNTADPSLPRILHGLIMQVDHSSSYVRTHARDCLLRSMTLLYKLPLSTSGQSRLGENDTSLTEVNWEWRHFWEHEDQGTVRDTVRTPIYMEALVRDALRYLTVRISDANRLWSAVALEWATNCIYRHIACRSFQIFRLLKPSVNKRMLAEILSRLSNTISDESPDAQLFSKEILITLSAILREIDTSVLAEIPQMVWAVVACLSTVSEEEFGEAVGMMHMIKDKLEDAPLSCYTAIESNRPPSLKSPKSTLIRLANHGLSSSTTANSSWSFIVTCLSSASSSVFVPVLPNLALLYALVLPWGLQALELGSIPEDICTYSTLIAQYAENQEHIGITRVMNSLAKNRFRTKDDYVRQAIGNMKEYFSIQERREILIAYLGLLLNPLTWLKLRSLTLLKAFVKINALSDTDLEGIGPDLLSPLLQLLPTELAPQALEIFDEPVPLVNYALSGSSRPGTASSRRPRTGESAVTKIIFGEPTETGWYMPDPEASRQTTRQQLKEVVDSCGAQSVPSRPASPLTFAMTDEVESIEPSQMDSKTQSDGGDTSTLGDMVDALHDLGTFFDISDRSISPEISASPAFRMSQALGSASRVAAVLARSFRGPSGDRSRSHRSIDTSMSAIPETPFTSAFAESNGPLRNPSSSSILNRFRTNSPTSDEDSRWEEESRGTHESGDRTGNESFSDLPRNSPVISNSPSVNNFFHPSESETDELVLNGSNHRRSNFFRKRSARDLE